MGRQDHERNVFYRLFNYRNRPDRTSEEDFLTQAYATVLLADTKRAASVLSELFAISISPDFTLSTQRQYGPHRPDMEFPDDNWIIFQEDKVWSGFGEGQFTGYQHCLSKVPGPPERMVVSCTHVRDEPEKDDVTESRHIRWVDVYRALKKHDQADPGTSILWSDFITFLEAKGMAPFIGVTAQSFQAFADVVRLRAQLLQLLDELREDIEKKYCVGVTAARQSPNALYLGNVNFTAQGDVTITPWIDFRLDGHIDMVLYVSPKGREQAFKDDEHCSRLFPDAGWGNYAARWDLTQMVDDAPGGDAAQLQKERVMAWIVDTLEPVVRLGLLRRK